MADLVLQAAKAKRCVFILPFLLAVLLFCASEAYAETVVVDSSDEFCAAMKRFSVNDSDGVSAQSDNEDGFSSCRLAIISDAEPDTSVARDVIFDGDNYYVLFFDTADETKAAYETFCNDEICAVPDYTVYADTEDGSYGITAVSSDTDPLADCWDAAYIGSDKMNNYLKYIYGGVENMPAVSVAVIDTGIDYEHEYLSNRVDLTNAYDYVNGDSDPMDDNKHGTHVAGIICRNTLANVTLVPYKILDENGGGSMTNVIYAIKKAYTSGADVINMSLTARTITASNAAKIKSAIKNLIGSNASIVAATGNISSSFTQGTAYPASFDGVIGVASCDSTGTRASSSNWDTSGMVDITAPGVDIRSTLPNNSYGKSSGTSMASPHVAAACAILKTIDPNYTSEETETLLEDTANSANTGTDYTNQYGAGILDLSALCDNYTIMPESLPQLVSSVDTENNTLSFEVQSPGKEVTAVVICRSNGVLAQDVMTKRYSESCKIEFDCDVSEYDTVAICIWDTLTKMKAYAPIYYVKK